MDPALPQGLFRTTLAGPGRSLADAFANLENSARVTRVLRHATRDWVSARVTLRPEEGIGHWELTRIQNDLYIILADFAYRNSRFESVPGDGLVQFTFKVSGDLNYGISRLGPLRFNRPSLHVWRQPQGIDMREWTAPSAHERLVAISVRPEFLTEYYLGSTRDVPHRLRAFLSPPGDRIDFCQLPLTAQMLEVTTKLIENPYPETLYLVYLEALTHELLCVALASLSSLPEYATEQINERELRALGKARRLLMERFAPVPTLKALACEVQLSKRTLTRGFQTLYGETPFDFSLRCRMQRAMTLLRDDYHSVDRVSEAVGYSHPTSFATAFLRHFGMRPIDVKRLKHSGGA